MTYKIKGFEAFNLDEVTKMATDFINSTEMKGQILDGYAIQTSSYMREHNDTKYIIVISYYDEEVRPISS